MKHGKQALDEMAPAVYGELRRLAHYYLSDEARSHTLQPTALVHEAYIRLVGQRSPEWQNRAQFVGLAATMMRRILLNHARARNAAKRNGDAGGIELEGTVNLAPGRRIEVLDLDRAMQRLSAMDAQQERIVELRFFGGLSVEETAEVLGISATTVKRDWSSARLWLTKQLQTR